MTPIYTSNYPLYQNTNTPFAAAAPPLATPHHKNQTFLLLFSFLCVAISLLLKKQGLDLGGSRDRNEKSKQVQRRKTTWYLLSSG